MNKQTETWNMTVAWLWIIAWTGVRLIWAGQFELAPDETNYWQWGRHLDWGYHDQAPLIGWAIALSTHFLGHTELGVRLPSIVALAVVSIYLILICRRWLDAQTALALAILSQAILEFNVGGLMATPDGLQAAAWAAATYHVARAYEEDRFLHWAAGGICFGIGLLSKYSMVLFAPCALAYGLFSPLHRHRLKGIKPYAGALAGALLFSPVLIWNAQNGWNSARHVAYLGGANQGVAIQWHTFGDFWAAQAALVTPLVFILVLAAWMRSYQQGRQQPFWMFRYLFWVSFPVFLFFMLLSLHTRVYGNWPAFGYLAAAVLTAAFYGRNDPHGSDRPWGRRLWPWAIGLAYVMTGVVLIQTIHPFLPIPVALDRTAREVNGWRVLGQAASNLRDRMPQPDHTFLFGLRYQIASELAFYTPGQPDTVSINRWNRPNVYDYWRQDADLLGWDAIGVTLSADSQNQLQQVFKSVDPPIALPIYRGRSKVKTFYLYRAFGFTGGLRWIPPANDIRAAG